MQEAEPQVSKRPRPVNALKHGHTVGHTLHGAPVTQEYAAWCGMKARCSNPKDRGFENYGGRGIKVCARWKNSFANFLSDMGRKPSPDHSIDRYPNNDGDYEPGNCRWATWSQQCSNRRTSVRITHNGETKTIREWGKTLGMSEDAIGARILKGWSYEKALTTPIRRSVNGRYQ